MIVDAHLHITQEDVHAGLLTQMEQSGIHGLVCGTTPHNCRFVSGLVAEHPFLTPSFGLHPWQADRYSVDDMLPWLQKAPVIGEIGMDSVWCKVDLSLQQEVFLRQLRLVMGMNKPVVLHIKGQEREAGTMLSGCTMPLLVHWYSCLEHLDLYLELGCYFTVGPDFRHNEAVRQVAARAPLNRLLVETDGLSALAWANEGPASPEGYPASLREIMAYVADIRSMSFPRVEAQMAENFHRFLSF